mgnify:CR=1 FL=1
MKILALDSSGLVASVALLENDNLVAEFTVNNKKTHSQTLLPMLDEVVNAAGIELDAVDAIAIAAGPGSFTGLRIGAATVKGLSLALDKPVVPVPTLEGLAFNLWGTDKLVCPIMDARRNQVYTGIYEFCKAEAEAGSCEQQLVMQCVKDQCASPVDELVDELNRLGREVIFLGDGVPVYRRQITEGMKVPFSFAPAANNRQRAASVASLGAIYYAQGKTVTAAEHEPEYLRKSQAEREREEQERVAKEAQA